MVVIQSTLQLLPPALLGGDSLRPHSPDPLSHSVVPISPAYIASPVRALSIVPSRSSSSSLVSILHSHCPLYLFQRAAHPPITLCRWTVLSRW